VKNIASKLHRWDEKASVRVKPRRLLGAEAPEKLLFSPELVPILAHPLVLALGPEAGRVLIAGHLDRYLEFTTHLELEVISGVSSDIALGKLGLPLPGVMRQDAFKLCTDEAHHACVADDLRQQLRTADEIRVNRDREPTFLGRLREIQERFPAGLRPLCRALFAVVSETLISGTLSCVPKDERVVTVVREVLQDHAEDEGRHSAFFSQFFGFVWPRLDRSLQEELGPLFAEFIILFLEPEFEAIGQSLSGISLGEEAIRCVIEETYPADRLAAGVRQAATTTLRLAEHNGLMEDPRIVDAFHSRGLLT
jgi:P-aminobenzoate N-oxygenase AurF